MLLVLLSGQAVERETMELVMMMVLSAHAEFLTPRLLLEAARRALLLTEDEARCVQMLHVLQRLTNHCVGSFAAETAVGSVL